jgi:hypothetical protein
LAAECATFFIWRFCEGDWRFPEVPTLSIFAHVMTYLGLLVFPSPICRIPGYFFGPHRYAAMIIGTLVLSNPAQLATALWLDDGNAIRIESGWLLMLLGASSVAATCGALLQLCFMNPDYRKSFYIQRRTFREHILHQWHTRMSHPAFGEGIDASHANLIDNPVCYLPQELVQAWLAEGWSRWEREMPSWFTLAWRQRLQKGLAHLLPAEALAENEHERMTANLHRVLLLPPIAIPTAKLEELITSAEHLGVDSDVLQQSHSTLHEAVEKQELVRSGSACDFWLLSAARILEHPEMESLPSWQELQQDWPGWLVLQTLTMSDACAGGFQDSILAVSHRWEHPGAPDSKGVQLKALREYLCTHPKIKWVFFDYSTMPQGGMPLPAAPLTVASSLNHMHRTLTLQARTRPSARSSSSSSSCQTSTSCTSEHLCSPWSTSRTRADSGRR